MEGFWHYSNSVSNLPTLNPATLPPYLLQAKQGVTAYHSAIGEPSGSLGFTQVAGKRRDEVRKGYKEAIKVAESQARLGGQD